VPAVADAEGALDVSCSARTTALKATGTLVLCAALVMPACNRQPLAGRCVDACIAGSQRCDPGGGLSKCLEPATANDCRTYGPSESCGAHRTCMGERCACIGQCREGESLCESQSSERRCLGPDADGCSYWGAAETCAGGVACAGASCGGAAACELGETTCGPAGELLSCQPDALGQVAWAATECAPHQTCLEGSCDCENLCESGGTRCEGTAAIAACEGPDGNGCMGWGTAAACPTGEVCKSEVGPAKVASCATATPACTGTSECDFEGQTLCQNETKYRECHLKEDGCLHLDCSS
jgi:hypothetical protein